jgi:hypothetical protein
MLGHGSGVTRRDVLVGAASGLALAAIDPGETLAQEATVSGIVFEDRDGTGVAAAIAKRRSTNSFIHIF